LAVVDRKNKYRVYTRYPFAGAQGKQKYQREFPDNFEFVQIKPSRLWTQVGLAVETWRHPVDVLFVPAHTLPVLKNPKVRGVVTIHDLGVEYLPAYHKFPQRYYLDLASRFAARAADAVIAVSAATKVDLESRYGVMPKKVFVVHEAVDRAFFKRVEDKEIEKVRDKYGIGGKYVLFVGTVQPRKNLETLIKAFQILVNSSQFTVHSRNTKNKNKETTNYEPLTTNLTLVIAGKPGWDFQPILDLPKKLGIEASVKFLGYVDKADLPALYSGATVFAFPSLFEGFGLPILEALACHCPVIASEIAVHKEIRDKVKDQRSKIKIGEAMILAKATNAEEWASFLYQSITLNINRIDFKAVENILASKFSWLEAAKATLRVFENVLE